MQVQIAMLNTEVLQLLHEVEILRGYANVSNDSIMKRRYKTLVLDHPPEEDTRHLVGTGVFVVRRKCYIQFHNDDSSSDEEGNNGGRSSTPPRVS